MNVIHIILQIVQVIIAIVLVVIVTSQTDKDQGMGGAFGGGESGGSKYSGGYEEKLDDLARNLSYTFLIISVFVALIGHRFL